MGGMLVSGLSYLVQHVLIQPALQFLTWAFGSIANGALAEARLPWVGQATTVSATVAATLFALMVAWRALQEYVLWNEGSSSDATGWWSKGVLRVAIYGALGTWLAYETFQFGIWLGLAYMAAPLYGVTQHISTMSGDIQSTIANVGMVLFLLVALVAVIISLIVVTFQMSVRGAELVYYIVAAPLMALGQFHRDGGVWNNWWRGLVVLSMSQTVQWLGLKGMLLSIQMMTTDVAGTQAFAAILLMLGWAWAVLRGPHIVREWSYRTGFAQGGQAMVSQAISYQLMRRS